MSDIIYINVLADSLQKKTSVLKEILESTKKQQVLLKMDSLDEEAFLKIIQDKQGYLDRMEELDEGFEIIYQRVRAELEQQKDKYQTEILKIQHLIAQITELSVDIEALEQRNKVQMDKVILDQKQKIKDKRVNNTVASNYYRNMLNHQYDQSYFLDKKK